MVSGDGVDRNPVIQAVCDVGFPCILPPGGPDTKHKRYTDEQVISILNEHEAGDSVPDR